MEQEPGPPPPPPAAAPPPAAPTKKGGKGTFWGALVVAGIVAAGIGGWKFWDSRAQERERDRLTGEFTRALEAEHGMADAQGVCETMTNHLFGKALTEELKLETANRGLAAGASGDLRMVLTNVANPPGPDANEFERLSHEFSWGAAAEECQKYGVTLPE